MIVDDHDIVRQGLKMIFSLSSELKVIAEASNGKQTLELLKNNKPDVILMDIRMPVMNGVDSVKKIKQLYPDIKVIILTTFNEDDYVFQGLRNGADGFILKDLKSDEIIKGIKEVYEGNILLQPEIATKVVKQFNRKKRKISLSDSNIKKTLSCLTPREKEIALLVASGRTNKEISDELYITEGTVRNHITKIFDKLEIRDRTQLALFINKVRS